MALIQCRECGQSVSTEAAACPHCGAPQQRPVPPLLPVQPQEQKLYSDNVVAVTTTRVIIGGATYALRNITSVKLTYTPPQHGCAILVLLGGLFLLLLIIIPFNENNYHPIIGCILGGSIMLGSIVWMSRIKTQYHVNLSSAAGEIHALTSKDQAYIEKIVVSINDAIARHQQA